MYLQRNAVPANPEARDNSITSESGFASETRKPRAARLWEGGRYPNSATESQNSWKGNRRSGESHLSPHGQLEGHLGKCGEIHSGAISGLLLSTPPLRPLPFSLPPPPHGERMNTSL